MADSVGLGKTFTSLAVVKYYENRNKSVLVLCPKKLSNNWNTYKDNYVNNPIAADRLNYDVLYHTDLNRTNGQSNGLDLDRLNWGNYDLVVIDESHNFRNGGRVSGEDVKKQNRYLILLNKVIRKGVKTKVLTLSATPVNNRFNDLKNQLALAYEGNTDYIDEKLNTTRSIDEIFKNAQRAFNTWSKWEPEKRTTESLLKMLDFDFFEVLDSVTIARSRKHIQNLAEIKETEGEFYIKFNHEMIKEHYIGFVSYVSYDRVMTVRLYPEQDSEVHIPKMYGGKFYFYCSRHGLFEQAAENTEGRKNGGANLTALMSAFARAYHFKHSENPIFADELSENLLGKADYERIEKFIADAKGDVASYVNEYLAPTPLARAKFCEDVLKNELRTGARQYVILGCGLDTFLLGQRGNGIEIFEIDTPEVIADKLRRMRRAGLNGGGAHYIAADLSRDDLKTVLSENGFDFSKKTVFSCLGLLYYLAKDEISALFEKISDFAAVGSTVVFDFADNHMFSSGVPRVAETVRMEQMSGNPMKSCFGYGELEILLQKHGFLIYNFLNDKDIGKYFENSGEISSFEHINFALAALQN